MLLRYSRYGYARGGFAVHQLMRRLTSAAREGRILAAIGRRLWPRRGYLRRCKGVIHVGANIGDERDEYARRGLDVIWIEPIPEIYAELEANLCDYPRQRAVHALITDEDGREVTLHVANNRGLSSSILPMHLISDIWPWCVYTHDVAMRSSRLPTVLADIDLNKYDALVLDTQGSELIVLRGAIDMLHRFRYIECEAPTFEGYRGCATLDEITSYLNEHGFTLVRKDLQAKHPSAGAYYDLLYCR
jgi:FkbM family methyltransferase